MSGLLDVLTHPERVGSPRKGALTGCHLRGYGTKSDIRWSVVLGNRYWDD